MKTEYCIGIDIGSTCAKTVVLSRDKSVLLQLLQPTGWSSVDTAEDIRRRLEEAGFPIEDGTAVATGYGRVSVPYADKRVTEITCHGRGACHIYGAGQLTVIDIGGQDTKIIRIENGAVSDFLMNDKCSAGTGRFLEIMANTLAVRPEELCRMAAEGGGVSISSMCTVFAESEVISHIGSGEKRGDIAAGVVDSVASRVAGLCTRHGIRGKAALTGGLCNSPYFIQRLSEKLGVPVETHSMGRYAGALGAALIARQGGKSFR